MDVEIESPCDCGHGKEFLAEVILINICSGTPPLLSLQFLIAMTVSKRLLLSHLLTFRWSFGNLSQMAFLLLVHLFPLILTAEHLMWTVQPVVIPKLNIPKHLNQRGSNDTFFTCTK